MDFTKLTNTELEFQIKSALPAPEVVRYNRYIPVYLKNSIWKRDQGRCTYNNCGSQHFLEIDHIKPLALGGKTELTNLRILCRTHNQREAIDKLGAEHMSKYLKRSDRLK